jgi:cellulose synthase/poly-beta-1,6-N-acetylglucosamine synthase-like glycosyltransferase
MKVKVTVGLCLKSSGKIVQTALDSISKQDFPHEALKLVIVDENETGIGLSLLSDFARDSDIKTETFLVLNKGLGGSRQIVVNNSEGDYVVWVDDDFVLRKDFIRKHVEFMDNNPSSGAALANEILAKRARKTMIDHLGAYHEILGKSRSFSEPMGGFEIFRLKAINQVGGYDTRINGAGEDRDISIRIKNAGWALSMNDSAEYYRKSPPNTWFSFWHKRFWYGYGVHFLFRKYRKKIRLELFLPLALLLGVRDSLKLYKIIRKKEVLFLVPYYFLGNIASFLGFFRADLDGYGKYA